MENSRNMRYILLATMAVLAFIALLLFMQTNEEATPRFGTAIDKASDSIDDAADELNPNRSPAEKLGDGLEEMGEGVRDTVTD